MQDCFHIAKAQNETSDQLVPYNGADWKDAVEAFLRAIDVKETTRKQYRKDLVLFFSWVNDKGIEIASLSRNDIIDYRKELLEGEKRLSAQTVAAYIVAIRRFYEWAEAERISPNIAKQVKSPKTKNVFIKQHLTPDECRDMLESLYDNVEHKVRKRFYTNGESNGLRDYAIVNLLLRTGLRTIELTRLNVEDVSIRRRTRVLNVWGKGRDTRDDFVPLSQKAYQPLMEYLGTRPDAAPSDPLFVCEGYGAKGRRMSTRRVQAVCKEALRSIGLDDHAFSAHSFRHTCAVMLIQSGVSAYDVQKFLRHSSIDTTEIYLKSIEEDLRLERSPEGCLDRAF